MSIRRERGLVEAPTARVDLGRILPAARHHHVVPLLADHMDLFGGHESEQLLSSMRNQRRRLLAATHDLHDVVRTLATAEVSAIVLKGLPLAVRTSGVASGRAIGDIDLLVDGPDLERAVDTLHGAGWHRRPMRANALDGQYRRWVRFVDNHEVLVADGRTAVEVHWRLSQSLATSGLFAGLLERSTSIDVAGVPVPVLGPVDDTTFNVVHAAKHGFERLKWAVDVARSWIELDDGQRAAAHATAIEWRSDRAFRFGLAMVARLGFLDGSPAGRAAADDLSNARTERLVDAVLELPDGFRARRRRRNRVRAEFTETWSDRGRHLGEVLFPSDVLSDPRVPGPLAIPAAPLRPLWRWRTVSSTDGGSRDGTNR